MTRRWRTIRLVYRGFCVSVCVSLSRSLSFQFLVCRLLLYASLILLPYIKHIVATFSLLYFKYYILYFCIISSFFVLLWLLYGLNNTYDTQQWKKRTHTHFSQNRKISIEKKQAHTHTYTHENKEREQNE